MKEHAGSNARVVRAIVRAGREKHGAEKHQLGLDVFGQVWSQVSCCIPQRQGHHGS